MDIVFIRHGRTKMNESGCYCGATDVEMSLRGIDEITSLKNHIEDLKFDCVFSSPLKRTCQTTDILKESYIIDDRLREINFGKFEGLTYKYICEKYPNESSNWEKDFINYKLPDGDSLAEVFKRTNDFIKDVSGKYDRILVVTHGGIIRCALSLVFGGPEHFYKFKVEHGTASVISVDCGYMYIKGINCRSNILEVLK